MTHQGARTGQAWDRFALRLVYVMWALIIFDVGQFLDAYLGVSGGLARVPTLLVPLLLVVIATRWRRDAIYWPFALFVLLQVIALPFVDNRGRTMFALQCLYPSYLLYVATTSLVDTPRKCFPILLMFLLSIAWYGAQGLSTGLVPWQTAYDENGYGALMVLGVAFAFPFGRGLRGRSWRILSFATAALGIAGAVISFARGAFLALIAVAAFLWIRSPRKASALLAGLAGVFVLLVVVEIRYPGGKFWREMKSVETAAEDPASQERWVINNLALEVFKQYPIFGVGANNFGPVASRTLSQDQSRSSYRDPATIWGRTLHNDYLQVLVEQGIVGFALYSWMIIDFFRRTRALRNPAAAASWRAATRGRLDLEMIAIGLEAAMIAYMVTALVYPQLYFHWYYTLLTFAGTLTGVSRRLARVERGDTRRRQHPSPARPPTRDLLSEARPTFDPSGGSPLRGARTVWR